MTRTQALNVADFLASKGYICTVGVFSDPPESPPNYKVSGILIAAGGSTQAGLQQLMTKAAELGFAVRAELSVRVEDA